jgi:hypothetical protein
MLIYLKMLFGKHIMFACSWGQKLREITKNLIQVSQCHNKNSNREPADYESRL